MRTISYHSHKNIIAKQLTNAREKKGLSQEQLAEQMQLLGVGIDQQAISRMELDRRTVTDYELMCFCKILEVDEKWLYGDFYKKL